MSTLLDSYAILSNHCVGRDTLGWRVPLAIGEDVTP